MKDSEMIIENPIKITWFGTVEVEKVRERRVCEFSRERERWIWNGTAVKKSLDRLDNTKSITALLLSFTLTFTSNLNSPDTNTPTSIK